MWLLELPPKTPAMRLLKSKDLREPYASGHNFVPFVTPKASVCHALVLEVGRVLPVAAALGVAFALALVWLTHSKGAAPRALELLSDNATIDSRFVNYLNRL